MVQYEDSLIDLTSPRKTIFGAMTAFVLLFVPVVSHADETAEHFFEKEVRPILIDNCVSCHGSKKQSGGLRVDLRQSLIESRESGAAIVPGDASKSLLLRAVRRDGDLAMPPEEELSDRAIRILEQWIDMGAPWPASSEQPTMSPIDAANHHWAFQPITRPPLPDLDHLDSSRNPIDVFVTSKLAEQQLMMSPPADRRTLIRRVSYSLTGLPPSPDDVDRFVSNPDPRAYEQLVERLLASDEYGEQWGRHWLDVARYSDTKGYVYAREERFWTHAWSYRDWVVQSLNDDMPYDRFLLLQLAADQVADREQHDLAAMGFLTLGRRFLGVQRDIIDDRIDVVCRGTMGLTVSCARCHDHKYDPIPTADYYSLYGVFASSAEQHVSLEDDHVDEAFGEELLKRQTALASKLATRRDEASQRATQRIADYLFAQTELHKYPANGFDQIFAKDDLLPEFARSWEGYLREARVREDPIFSAWHQYADIPAESFARQAVEVSNQLQSAAAGAVNPLVANAFKQSPKSFREVCDRYGQLFAEVNDQWAAELAKANEAKSETPAGLSDPNAEALRRVMHGPQSPCQVPDGAIMNTETYFDSAACTELWKLQGEVDRWIVNSKYQAPFALALIDCATPVEPRIFRRGNPLNLGNDVPRQFLSVLTGDQREPFQDGSGRLELARAIIDRGNPLTARVIVNRVWAHHFGSGLVLTPSDFGTRATPPSHPELLDWLASELIAEGWSLKKLHRWIVSSATYRQSSSVSRDREELERAMEVDPDNRLLWRANSRRLTFEEFRDSMLTATNELDRALGGKATALFKQPFPKRRTLYGLVDRQYLPGALRMFDFANPDLHVAKRTETTVPQQALFFMNHPIVLERSKTLAALLQESVEPRERVARLFRQVLQRDPTDVEVAEALALVDAAATAEEGVARRVTAADWQYGYGAIDEESEAVTGFTPLPHFTGQAWRGGPKWPDAKLGWVSLTADGGHPGNDRLHAAVRRWTAPRDMTVRIQSQLNHEPTAGDGIRAFVVCSTGGIRHSVTIHHDATELDVESLVVSKGDTIDFVVDIKDVLNSDQYLWKATIAEATSDNESINWDSVADFPSVAVDQLDGWEQLAQVILCSNEFMFVD